MSLENKRVVLFGSSGFIGRHLQSHLQDWEVVTVDRTRLTAGTHRAHEWDGKSQGEWTKALDGAHAVINLAGSPIAVKWTDENRAAILNSRTEATRAIGAALAAMEIPPKTWINASAIGFYGDRGEETLTEKRAPGIGFLMEVCQAWEQEISNVPLPGTRKAWIRTGVVLGRDGGAFPPLRQLAALGLGGAAGSGRQWLPWIHIQDMCAIYRFVLEAVSLAGAVNATAPEPIRNGEFMKAVRHSLGRPWSPPVPAWALQGVGKIIGPDSSLLLSSTRVVPEVAVEAGFQWSFGNLEQALANLG